jgi:site-specific DNA-methyltransferase (adenine-specific)/site-specific DNA-methyltransferase (cytosine-N4-specific)
MSVGLIESSWFQITETGLRIVGDFTKDQWEELGSELSRNSKSLMWIIGDWLLAGESEGYLPRGKLDEACERFGIAYKTAANAKAVCSKIESSRRREDLGFHLHAEVAGRSDAPELLEWASKKEATVKELREEKKRRQAGERLGSVQSAGKSGNVDWSFQVADCRSLPFPDDHFDLVFCSPPYEAQRSYSEVEFNLSGDEYVQWAADCYMECLRVSKGLVAWVIEGVTEKFSYSYTPFLLGAEIQKRGAKLRKPVVYQRNGIPGTGGPDWLRNDWEPIICATKNGRLPWSDNTAMGSAPKQNKPRQATNRNKDGTRKDTTYNDPDICNPGNIIKGLVGCGGLGWDDAHENEAPFPEWLAEFFIKSFCPPGGVVLDPFSGSGTTVSVAAKNGRSGIGTDVRASQIWLGETRLMGLSVNERKQGQGVLA